MKSCVSLFVPPAFRRATRHCLRTSFRVLLDLALLLVLALRTRARLAAENLLLRKQLALYQERNLKPRRADDSTRWLMATLSHLFVWRDALINVKPDTLIRWQRKGFRLFLALEVSAGRTATRTEGSPSPDSPHGGRESRLGRGAHCQ